MKSKQQYIRFILVFGAIILWAAAFTGEKYTHIDPIDSLLQQAGTFLSYCEETLISQDHAWLKLS